jgi:hypothetical protein
MARPSDKLATKAAKVLNGKKATKKEAESFAAIVLREREEPKKRKTKKK